MTCRQITGWQTFDKPLCPAAEGGGLEEVPLLGREEPLKNHQYHLACTSLSRQTDRMLAPTVEPADSASSRMNRKTICKLTCRSTAVRLIGAALMDGELKDTERNFTLTWRSA
jgi:hypothetical protein